MIIDILFWLHGPVIKKNLLFFVMYCTVQYTQSATKEIILKVGMAHKSFKSYPFTFSVCDFVL